MVHVRDISWWNPAVQRSLCSGNSGFAEKLPVRLSVPVLPETGYLRTRGSLRTKNTGSRVCGRVCTEPSVRSLQMSTLRYPSGVYQVFWAGGLHPRHGLLPEPETCQPVPAGLRCDQNGCGLKQWTAAGGFSALCGYAHLPLAHPPVRNYWIWGRRPDRRLYRRELFPAC